MESNQIKLAGTSSEWDDSLYEFDILGSVWLKDIYINNKIFVTLTTEGGCFAKTDSHTITVKESVLPEGFYIVMKFEYDPGQVEMCAVRANDEQVPSRFGIHIGEKSIYVLTQK